VVDLDTGQDATLLFDGWAATPELGAQYSPDGKRLAMMRFGNDGFRITIVPADTNGPAVAVGPTQPSNTGGATIMWSPDGSQLLVSYDTDHSVWLLPSSGGDGRKLDDMDSERGVTWQRLAP
jgi:Tol biopolymer transport system component